MASPLEARDSQLPTATNPSVVVHHVHSQSTDTWQYVVADPSTGHCIVLDPVRDRCADAAMMSTTAADIIVALVKDNKYIVDYILETNTASAQCLSAAWYLRMQFSQSQGWPPQLCNEAAVSSLQAMWQRKYGADSKFSTTIRPGLDDGEILPLGRLSLACMHLPGLGSPHRRAYLIDNNIFGAHTLATFKEERTDDTSCSSSASTDVDSEVYFGTWASVQRILSLPSDTRVWHESGGGGMEQEGEPYSLVSNCVAVNRRGDSNESEFLARRREESAWAKPPSSRAGSLKARLGNWLTV